MIWRSPILSRVFLPSRAIRTEAAMAEASMGGTAFPICADPRYADDAATGGIAGARDNLMQSGKPNLHFGAPSRRERATTVTA